MKWAVCSFSGLVAVIVCIICLMNHNVVDATFFLVAASYLGSEPRR